MLVLSVTFSQHGEGELLKQYAAADKLYREAELVTDDKKADELNKQALDAFKKILPKIDQLKNDSLAFYCYFKTAVLQAYFGDNAAANIHYNEAIQFRGKTNRLSDSLFFQPLLYSGITYYFQGQFDSAIARYKQAESIADKYGDRVDGIQRLYNNLGVIYYERGNYGQAKNYFENAISTLPHQSAYDPLLVNYKINIAQSLSKLGEYTEAYDIYKKLLPYKISRNEILHNMGLIHLTLNEPQTALEYFKQVEGDNKTRLYNDIAYAFYKLSRFDSTHIYLEKAKKESEHTAIKKNIPYGQTMKYEGDVLVAEGKINQALPSYQRSLLQFDNDFNDTAITAVPMRFSGIFSYVDLFNALTAKADAFELLSQKEKQREKENLEAALNAYRSAFRLVDYVEKSYESDEARLFLNKIKYTVHDKPISISLRLYELTHSNGYLEEAYLFDQRNKASVLSFSLNENNLQQQAGIPDSILTHISSVKSSITRLSLKAGNISDSATLVKINKDIRDNEIELARLQDKINSNPKYAELQPGDHIPAVATIREKILDDKTALLSYHLSSTELLTLIIKNDRFDFVQQKIDSSFFQMLDSFVTQLHHLDISQKYEGQAMANALYNILIAPALKKVTAVSRMIIIPDDELNYLPFEALQDNDKKYLLQSFAIQYQYSTALLNRKNGIGEKSQSILAMAPFTDSSSARLDYSAKEIEGLKGKIYTGAGATKNIFIRSANQSGLIHLATHASANDKDPLQSYIAFHPSQKDSAESYKLYAREIYNLHLDSTDLVILSACETGTGQLVRGEGVMSLSRAFAYAGCPNIITSLWKAEDRSTAFISSHLHQYLKKGLPKDMALQQAKIDLLNAADIDPHLKTPNYWSHLIFIGDYEKEEKSQAWWWIAGGILFALIVSYFIKRKSPRNRET